jgi:hypothetical protein
VVFGRPAGAPLGTYDPLNLAGLDPFNPFVFISGTFNRFSDAEILARYPTRQAYVCSVALAAVSAAVRHYITGDDAEALIEAARNEPLPVGTQARQLSSANAGAIFRESQPDGRGRFLD